MLSGNLTTLETLLTPSNLHAEVIQLQNLQAQVPGKGYYDNRNTRDMVQRVVDQNRYHNVLDSYLSVLPSDDLLPSSTETSVPSSRGTSGGVLFHRLLHSVEILPTFAADLRKLGIINRGMLWEMCRSLVVVYHWYLEDGPATATWLLHIHRHYGYAGLKGKAPFFADLVDHVVQYMLRQQTIHTSQSKADGAKRKAALRRRTGKAPKNAEWETGDDHDDDSGPARKPYTRQNEPTETTPLVGPSVQDVEQIPWTLYGMREGDSSKTISFTTKYKVQKGLDELYSKCIICLQELWSHHLIIPQLKPIDKQFNGNRRNYSDIHVWQRSFSRGAVLTALAKALNTDAIFASIGIYSYLVSPLMPFHGHLANEAKFSKAVLKSNNDVLAPLVLYIKTVAETNPEIKESVASIGNIVQSELLKLVNKGLTDLEDGRESELVSSNPLIALKAPGASKGGNKKNFLAPSMDTLLPKQEALNLSILGLIIREALNRARKLPPGNTAIHKVLIGTHAALNSKTHRNPDHTDPIRRSSVGARLLKTHITGKMMTSPEGISNLLSWLGTGQGYETQGFLETITPRETFFAHDVTTMVQTFQTVMSLNAQAVVAYGRSNKRNLQEIPGYIPLDDLRIWGQPNNHLSATPTLIKSGGAKLTLLSKFQPYFDAKLQKKWTTWLGDLAGHDPDEYEGPRNSWKSALDFAKETGLPGFGSGLTQLQFANSLAFGNVVDMPPMVDVTAWIAIPANSRLGAYRGMNALGISLWDKLSVQVGFKCIFSHLDDNLTEDDKVILGFDPIFLEHSLCKVLRFEKHLRREARISIAELGAQALAEQENSGWIAGENKTNHTSFPFPLQVKRDQVEAIIQTVTNFIEPAIVSPYPNLILSLTDICYSKFQFNCLSCRSAQSHGILFVDYVMYDSLRDSTLAVVRSLLEFTFRSVRHLMPSMSWQLDTLAFHKLEYLILF